jgi:hypothetical protein
MSSEILGSIIPFAEQDEFFAETFGKKACQLKKSFLCEEARSMSFLEMIQLIEARAHLFNHANSHGESSRDLPSIKLVKDLQIIDSGLTLARGINQAGESYYAININNIKNLVEQGSTLIINSIYKLIPVIHDRVRQLENILGCECSLNLYYTPAHSQGFPTHWDDHDVFIFQIGGSKSWFVGGAAGLEPHRHQKMPATDLGAVGLMEHFMLRHGEALYIPRGYWHHAKAEGEESLHLTLGIHLPTLSERIAQICLSNFDLDCFRRRYAPKPMQLLGLTNNKRVIEEVIAHLKDLI